VRRNRLGSCRQVAAGGRYPWNGPEGNEEWGLMERNSAGIQYRWEEQSGRKNSEGVT